MIKRLRLKYSVPALCRYLKVSESGYYAWLNRKPSKRAQEDAWLTVEIKAIHKRNRQRRQARLGYLSPVAYEKKFIKQGLRHE